MTSRNLRETLLDVATLLTTVCVVVLLVLVIRRPTKADAEDREEIATNVPLSHETWESLRQGDRALGGQSASFVLVEFGDYECPACSSFARSWGAFEAAHPGEVALVFRHYPLSFHRFAYPAARAAECAAEQGRFAPMHQLLMESQDSLGLLPFAELGRRAGVRDFVGFTKCIESTTTVAGVERDKRLAQELGVHATPTIFMNGARLEGIPDSTQLEALFLTFRKETQ